MPGAGRATIHSLERHLAETSARVERLGSELDEARAATRAADDESRNRREERDALDRDLVALRAEHEAERRAATEARAEQATHAADLQAALGVEKTARGEERHAAEARFAEHEAALSEARTTSARAADRAASLDARLAERTSERDAARADLSELKARTHELVVERDARAADRDAHVTALLERLVADERSDRVLSLLESLERRTEVAARGADGENG